MYWNQKSIYKWSRDTFGDISNDPVLVSLRMEKEAIELLEGIMKGLEKCPEEAADVLIVLYQVAEIYDIDLENMMDAQPIANVVSEFFSEQRNNTEIAYKIVSCANSLTTAVYNKKAVKILYGVGEIRSYLEEIGNRLGSDLLKLVNKKMEINTAREWGEADDGSYQHK